MNKYSEQSYSVPTGLTKKINIQNKCSQKISNHPDKNNVSREKLDVSGVIEIPGDKSSILRENAVNEGDSDFSPKFDIKNENQEGEDLIVEKTIANDNE